MDDNEEIKITFKINIKRLEKFWVRKRVIMEYPFGQSIYTKVRAEISWAFLEREKENNYTGLDAHLYNTEKVIYKGMEDFYAFIYKGIARKPFTQVKTKQEKELKKKYDLIDYSDKETKITAGIKLARKITARFFRNNPHLKGRDEIISSFAAEYINEKTKIISLINEVEIKGEMFDEFQAEMKMLKSKLKRNTVKDNGLDLYKEVINQIAKVEDIGHKPNLQRICNNIAAKKNLKTDLRKAFDQWRKRNKETYLEILQSCKRNMLQTTSR